MYQSDSKFKVLSPDPVDMDPATGDVLLPGDDRLVHTHIVPERVLPLGELLTRHGLGLSYARASDSTKQLIAKAARLAEDAEAKNSSSSDQYLDESMTTVCADYAADYSLPAALSPEPGTQEYLEMLASEREDDNPYGGQSFYNRDRASDYGNRAPLVEHLDSSS